MRAAKNELAKRRVWLGVTALGILACSLALAGAPGRQPAPGVHEAAASQVKAASNPSTATPASQAAALHPDAGTVVESPVIRQRVRGGQMPKGELQVIANVVVDYRDDEMTKARVRGELVGPLPMPSELGVVAAGGCSFDFQCDDANPCTIDTCDFTPGSPIGSGKCEYNPVPDGFNSVFGGGISEDCDGTRTCGCDDDNYCNGFETCQGAVCAVGSFRNVGETCDSHDDCRQPGVCNLTTGECTSGDTGACASNDDCAFPGTGTCSPGTCDATPPTPTCCADFDSCLPGFAVCSEDSDNSGDHCDTDQECRGGGRCDRCRSLCKTAADCDDKSKCNGTESCASLICHGGSNNGNTCTTDANCPKLCVGGGNNGNSCSSDVNCPDGICKGACLGTCARGTPPCGFGADCDEGHCTGGTKTNQVCAVDGDCPGGYCGKRCVAGPNNGDFCGDCPGGNCQSAGQGEPELCVGGGNAGRPCGVCGGAGVCGTGRVCYAGRCCSAVSEPECTKGGLIAVAPNPACVGNWYAGDGGQELIEGAVAGCGGGPADFSEDWGCPKYSAGLTQTSLNSPPQRLVVVGPVSDASVAVPGPGGPGGALNKLGDDYTLTNGSFMDMEVMRWVGAPITAADRILIEFYDASNILVEDIVLPGVTGTDIGVIVVQFNPKLTIPPSGSVVARVASAFSPNTRFVWASTNAAAVGTNNANSLWVNGGPAANFLSPNPGILAFELAGDNGTQPSGACCNAVSGECSDGVLPWACAAQGNIFNGLNTKCATCNGGPQTGLACRKCAAGGPHAGLACSGDAVCGECSQAGTQPCLTNADCGGGGNTCTTGDCVPNNATCTGTNFCYYGGVGNPNDPCPCDVGGTCGPPQCVAELGCGSGACCNPTTGNCSYPGSPATCDGTCPSGTCVGGAGAGLPCSTAADCKFFQGFGTNCDADDGLGDAAQQHCCPQPDLGQKCMGSPTILVKRCSGLPANTPCIGEGQGDCPVGQTCNTVNGTCDPVSLRCWTGDVGEVCTVVNQAADCDIIGRNMLSCTTDSDCRRCSGGLNNGQTCTVHADCARCRGGSTPNAVCVDDTDCPGEGVCAGHCLGVCGTLSSVADTRHSGADNCADAVVHQITVPLPGEDPVTITITGNNDNASSTVENPDSCWAIATGVGSEPGWWEAFHIDSCAWVRLDFCCTKPVHEPAWAFLSTDCDCANTLANTPNPYHFGEVANFRGPKYCDEDNLWQSFGPLSAGTYYYPIYSVLAGHHGDYQMHVTVEACPTAVCCLPDGTCAHPQGEESDQTDCDALGGFFLAAPNYYGNPQPLCTGTPCQTGSCCVAPGDCRDTVSDLPGGADDDTPMTRAICDEAAFSGTFVGGTKCAGGTCNGGGDAGESCRVAADCAAGTPCPGGVGNGNCCGTAADLAQPNPCPLCEYFADETCDREAGPYVWLSDESAVVNPTRQCNDIMPTVTGTLREICVLGHYITTFPEPRRDNCEDDMGGLVDSFTVRLYAPDPHRYFPGAILGEWETEHVPDPRGVSRTVLTWGAGQKFYDFQLTLNASAQYPLVELQAGQIYFLEVTNNTTGGDPTCNFWMLDNGPGQGNNYAFLDGCGTEYTEGSVKLFVADPDAMRDPSWCLNVPYEPPPTPVRACCTGDPLNPCTELPIRECAEIAGDWQFAQLSCTGYVCPVDSNDFCARAPFVKEGDFGFNLFGATRDGNELETCAEPTVPDPQDFGGDIWYFYQPSASGQALITTCDCELGGDEVIAVYRNAGNSGVCACPGDSGMTLMQCRDLPQANYQYPAEGCPFGGPSDVVLNVNAGSCYTVRVATDVGSTPARSNLRIALNPAKCGNNTRELAGGEQCDGFDDLLCPGECDYTCLCPPTVCGKQCVGGVNAGLACNNIGDCPSGSACAGQLDVPLGEECDTSAGGAGTSPCTSVNTLCKAPGDLGGRCSLAITTVCDDDTDCPVGQTCVLTLPCSCIPVCGNGRREGGELCDGQDDDKRCSSGTNSGQSCTTDANCPPGTAGLCVGTCAGAQCTGECRCEATCGNGVLEIGEQCDSGGVGGSPPPSDALCKTRCIPKKCNGLPADTLCTGPPGQQGTCPNGQICVAGPDACTCPPPSCGNNYTEKLSNDEECDGSDFAGESDCPGEACRPPGDPAGECTCVCAGSAPVNTVVWDPALNPIPWPNTNPLATTRSLRFTVTGPEGPSKPEAIKVTMVDLQHPNPPNLAIQPPPNLTTYDTRLNGVCVGGTLAGHHCDTTADCTSPGTCTGGLAACTADPTCTNASACTLPSNGCARWVGKLGTFYESQGPPVSGPYKAARLQCTPYYWDWKPEGLLTVVGADVAPSSEYSVQVYGASCLGVEGTCTDVSAPVTMYTRRSGDVEQPFNPPSATGQPDVTDVSQLVNKFKNLPGAPVKAISQIQPNLPELNANINVLDILAVVDALKGVKYAFSGPCACPSLVTCELTACTSDTPCINAYGAGSKCVKVCTGPGSLTGDLCIDNTHCVGSGTCGSGFCRDRCVRCKP